MYVCWINYQPKCSNAVTDDSALGVGATEWRRLLPISLDRWEEQRNIIHLWSFRLWGSWQCKCNRSVCAWPMIQHTLTYWYKAAQRCTHTASLLVSQWLTVLSKYFSKSMRAPPLISPPLCRN